MTEAGLRRVAIVGLGLVGGALARALRAVQAGSDEEGGLEIRASSRAPADLVRATEEGVVDRTSTEPEEILEGAELVVYATPLHATLALLEQHAPLWDGDAVVTDVAGLKAPVLERMKGLGQSGRYVGSHPMAGGEGHGYGAAEGSIFRDARVWLVQDGAEEPARSRVPALWRSTGAVPRWTEAADHDRSMIWCSHLPQLLANALAGALDVQGITPDELGPGGRDMVRLAGSSPEMWKDLLAASGPSLAPAVSSVSRALETVAELLARRDVQTLAEFMDQTRRWKEGPVAVEGGVGE